MKWILLPLLWCLAILIAVAVIWRLWRGQNVVLRGRWSPRIVRMVAIVVVVLGFGIEEARSAPIDVPDYKNKPGKTDADEPLPLVVTAESIILWGEHQHSYGLMTRLKQNYVLAQDTSTPPGKAAIKTLAEFSKALPPKLQALFKADIEAMGAGKELPLAPARELIAALDEAESKGMFDHWMNAYLWRKSAAEGGDRKDRIELHARFHRHARLTNTLIRAHAQVKPVMLSPRAWMSKAGPPKGWQEDHKRSVAEMLAAAKTLHPSSDAGTWRKDGLALFMVSRQSAPFGLIRGGQRQVPKTEETISIGRLDLIETPAGDKPVVLDHPWLGKVQLPADRLLSVWDLSRYLSDYSKDRLKETIGEALDGNVASSTRLEQALPLAHAALRESLAKNPQARGAPRLRLILALFDDAVMPVLGATEEVETSTRVSPRGLAPRGNR